MTLAASLDGNLIFYIAAAAYGVFAWWNDRRQKKAAEEEAARTASQRSQNPQAQQRPAAQGGETSEQERMRKFLEALGVPTGQAPAQPRPQSPPAPLRPPSAPASPTLAPRPVAMPVPRPMVRPQTQPATKAYVPPPAPKPRPVIVNEPLPAESRDPGRLEEPATTIESVSTEFARMHDRPMAVSTDPSIAVAASGNAPTTSVLPQVMSAQGRLLRELLRRPESVRAAIVVSEVLGPPKGA